MGSGSILLETDGVPHGTDLAVLPEQFRGKPPHYPAETVGGPTITVTSASPLFPHDLSSNNSSDGSSIMFNSAVVLGRDGTVIGLYDKMSPVYGNTTTGLGPLYLP
eukprot:gene4039-4386_t